ncbi:type VII secretion integral membrane protein EccD [Gordonia sp. L191]|uniref:type VII secretion integral membrane protein EccD n=1 Tax=Gordonia sp. L191 TaxID=2982699 RepID=UPI0024BF542D|nr:type VII secretion integral membrane protein EccD [Gordonia sp. L191]WHU45456.1 type VII secretion integral membrane protein EccD [Gordonia sp. L191]
MSSVDTRPAAPAENGALRASAPSIEPALVRVSVLGGNTQLDVALPAAIPVAALIGDLVAQIESRSPRRHDPDDTEPDPSGDNVLDRRSRWTLSRIGQPPLPVNRSLADSGVRDGDLLMVTSVRTDDSPALFDDVVDAVARLNESRFANWSAPGARVIGFAAAILAAIVGAVALAGMRWHSDVWWPAIPAATMALALVTASAIVAHRYRDDTTATVLAAAAAPTAFVAGMLTVPGDFGSAHLSLGFAVVVLVCVVSYRLSAVGAVVHAALLTASVLGGAISVAVLLIDTSTRNVAAVGAAAVLLVVAMAPRLTIVLAKLPLPPVPTAGVPLDPDDAQPVPTIEGIGAIGAMALPKADALERRSYLANAYLTGIVAGATAVIGPTAVITATPWTGVDTKSMALAVILAVVMCLRGRSHSDLVQACVLISGGVLTLAALVGSLAAVDGWWPFVGFVVAATALVVALVLGVIAPGHEFSPVMRRLAELGEYALIVVIVPLLVWILDLYQTVRDI